jgi:hypothetical protein
MAIINVSRKVAGHSFRIRTVNKLNEENRTFLKKKKNHYILMTSQQQK